MISCISFMHHLAFTLQYSSPFNFKGNNYFVHLSKQCMLKCVLSYIYYSKKLLKYNNSNYALCKCNLEIFVDMITLLVSTTSIQFLLQCIFENLHSSE
jgi:hypothetical protein